MASSGSGLTDEELSGSKIEPLASPVKYHVPHADGGEGVIGFDHDIDESRIAPLGGKGQHEHTAPHADSQGVVGTDGAIAQSKIAPFDGKGHESQPIDEGLSDEAVDTARIQPLGEVREE